MLDQLKQRLNNDDQLLEASMILSEMSDGGALEDDIFDQIAISNKDEKEIENLINKIPDEPIGGTGDDSKDNITDQDLKYAASNIADPTLDELLEDDDLI